MKKLVYIYILNFVAEWEIGSILQGLTMNSTQNNFIIKTVSIDKNPIKTIGGLTIIPECSLDELDEKNMVALLLPGSEEWEKEEHSIILGKALNYIKKDILVGAICGATLALANLGILNKFKHTSNSLDYLMIFSKKYTGKKLYIDSLACIDKNLVTASSAGGLLWAKYIMEYLDVFPDEIIELWYQYYSTGDPKYCMELISKLQQ